jgi:hypothetical protein
MGEKEVNWDMICVGGWSKSGKSEVKTEFGERVLRVSLEEGYIYRYISRE